MAPPNQGFRYTLGLTAAATDKTGALVAACGASRGGGVQLSGTWTATVLFEQSLDSGATWISKTVYPAAGGAGVTTASANGQWKFACGGETHVRVRCSAFTSGTIVVDAAFTAGADTAASSTVIPATVAAATVSSLASAATSATLLSANTSRKGLIVQNTDANDLYLKYGTTASATDFTVRIAGSGGYWEMPQPVYTGRIDAIWAADGSGSAFYTEL